MSIVVGSCPKCGNEGLRQAQGESDQAADHLRWMAQTVHQAYHTDQAKNWRDCPVNICASTRNVLKSFGRAP